MLLSFILIFFSIKSTWWYNTLKPCISTDTQFFVTPLTFQMKGFSRSWPCRPQSNWMPYNLVNSFSLSMWSCMEGARSVVIEEESEWCRLNLTFKLLLWDSSQNSSKKIVNYDTCSKKRMEMVTKFIHLFKTFTEYLLYASHCARHRTIAVNRTNVVPVLKGIIWWEQQNQTKICMIIIEISTIKDKLSRIPAFLQVSRMKTT